MKSIQQYIGIQFNRLVIVQDLGYKILKSGKRQRQVLCRCYCGNEKQMSLVDVKCNRIKSCGCLQKEKSRNIKGNLIHGMKGHKIYHLYAHIKSRCYSKTHKRYHDWGGRGILMCDEWLSDFMSFYNWCMDNGWMEGLQIDRIDNDGNYEPSNCRFVESRQNNLNRRMMKCNTSGYEGIFFRKDSKKWRSMIRVYSKLIHIGTFIDKKDALEARNNYIIQNDLTHEYKIQEWRNE